MRVLHGDIIHLLHGMRREKNRPPNLVLLYNLPDLSSRLRINLIVCRCTQRMGESRKCLSVRVANNRMPTTSAGSTQSARCAEELTPDVGSSRITTLEPPIMAIATESLRF